MKKINNTIHFSISLEEYLVVLEEDPVEVLVFVKILTLLLSRNDFHPGNLWSEESRGRRQRLATVRANLKMTK